MGIGLSTPNHLFDVSNVFESFSSSNSALICEYSRVSFSYEIEEHDEKNTLNGIECDKLRKIVS